MIQGARVVVVIPARNEEARIGRVLATLPAEVDRAFVVDDGSTDGTARVAHAIGDARITVLVHRANRGVGAAIATGYRAALGEPGDARDAFVVMAGDAQMDPADLPALVAPVIEGRAGYVKGNRFAHPDVRRAMPRARYAGGVVFSRLTSAAVGRRVVDSQCGYTAIARAACARLDLDALWPGYGYPNDLIAMAVARGVALGEVTVRPVYAGEASGLRVWHCARIAQLCARAYVRRVRAATARSLVTSASA